MEGVRIVCWLLIAGAVLLGGGGGGTGAASGAELLFREPYASVPHVIADAGYPVERHRVRTEDGYILQMHRIPAGRRTARRTGGEPKKKRAVLLVHGLLGSSGDFIMMGPERSLAYMLADGGYDVWLGNLRGNDYSSHVNWTKSDPEFWEFSFDEHGKYDVTAFIDKILSETHLTKILYLGYSMGTTSFFVMASERPEYQDKLEAFIGLAPAVYLDNVRPLSRSLVQDMGWTRQMRSHGIYSLSLRRELRDLLSTGVCNVRRQVDDLCMRAIYSIVGEDYEQNDWRVMPLVIARAQPASLRQIEHFSKIALTGKFMKWGDGMKDLSSSAYNLSGIRIPVHLFYGKNDQLTEKTQVWRLARDLGMPSTERTIRSVAWRKFNHLDFVFAKEVDKILNNDIVAMVGNVHASHRTLETNSTETQIVSYRNNSGNEITEKKSASYVYNGDNKEKRNDRRKEKGLYVDNRSKENRIG